MRSCLFLVMGIIFIGTGIFVYYIVGTSFAAVPSDLGLGDAQALLQYGMGGLFVGIGAIMTLGGLIGMARGAKKTGVAQRIAQIGTETEATVNFVDKNYSMLVNNRPIYSIVEYTYQDDYGNEHTNRIDNVSTEQVIRNKVEVGSKIKIKYLPEDPGQSVMV